MDDILSAGTWSALLNSVLEDLITPRSEVALFDFPFYLNPGDTAIALGEFAWLARRACNVRCVVRRETVGSKWMPTLPGTTTILFHGGGNLGDLYPEHVELLGRVLDSYPSNAVVCFPQTASFSEQGSVRELRRCLGVHGAPVTMMWRDRRSFAWAKEVLPESGHVLSPDAAAGFLGWQRLQAPTVDCTWLLRRDSESASGHVPSSGSTDWPYGVRDRIRWKSLQTAHSMLDLRPGAADWERRSLYRRLGILNVTSSLGVLSRARIVITDRLHGHILSTMMGIPNVAVNDVNGKVRDYFSTWSTGIPYTRFAQSVTDARELVKEIDPLA